jgi:hypothetical protein
MSQINTARISNVKDHLSSSKHKAKHDIWVKKGSKRQGHIQFPTADGTSSNAEIYNSELCEAFVSANIALDKLTPCVKVSISWRMCAPNWKPYVDHEVGLYRNTSTRG